MSQCHPLRLAGWISVEAYGELNEESVGDLEAGRRCLHLRGQTPLLVTDSDIHYHLKTVSSYPTNQYDCISLYI